jgi:hypothetical protein
MPLIQLRVSDSCNVVHAIELLVVIYLEFAQKMNGGLKKGLI